MEDWLKQQEAWAERAQRSQAQAAQAFERLLRLTETGSSGQVRSVARFIAATFDGEAYPLDLFALRAVDVEISDDMLLCLDALRWGKAELYKLVPEGERRIAHMCQAWGVKREWR